MNESPAIPPLFRIAGLVAYLLFSLYYVVFGYSHFSPDTVAYFQIAKLYSQFDFSSALNAYWSPLLSWLLAPLMFVGVDAFTAFKIINASAGILMLYWANQLLNAFKISQTVKITCLSTLLLVALSEQVKSFTPDFMSACLCVGFVTAIIRRQSWTSISVISLCLIFSKSIFLPISLFMLSGWVLYSKELRKTHGKVMMTIILVAVLWTALLSFKYERFIVNSSSQYNLALSLSKDRMHFNSRGLITPSQENMIFSWQDPTYYPLESSGLISEVLRVAVANIRFVLYFFFYSAWAGIVLCVLPMLAFYYSAREERAMVIFLLSICFTGLSAYLLFIPEERYYIPVYLIWILVCFYSLEKIKKLNVRYKNILALFLLTLFLKQPIESVYTYSYTQAERKKNSQLVDEVVSIVHQHQIQSVASNSDNLASTIMALASYRTQCTYHGELAFGMQAHDQLGDLKKHRTQLLCVFGKEPLAVEQVLTPQINFISTGLRWYVLR